MKAKPLLALAGAASFAVAGCGGESVSGIRGASIVPASAAAFVAIDTDPGSSQWQSVEELASRFPEREDAVAELEDSLRSDAGLDYETDVRPALGPELDLVWLDFEGGGTNVVGVMQPHDPEAFRRAIATGNAEDPSTQLVYEEVDGWTVIGDDRAAIDAFRRAVEAEGPVLADDDAFRQAMGGYAADALVKAYVSGSTVMDELRTSVSSEDRDFLDEFGSLDWLALSLRASSEGVRFDTTVRGRPGSLLLSQGGAAPDFELTLPAELPGDVLAYVAFHGVAGMLTDLENNPALRGLEMADARSILRQAGVLLEGEGALYVRPSDGEIPELTLVTTPRVGTDGAATVDRILADAGVAGVESAEIAGADARRLGFDEAFELAYANVGGKLVVTTAPAGIEGVAQPSSTLEEAAAFEDAVEASGVPENVQSFAYVDVRGGLDLVERLSGAPVPESVKRNVGPLSSAVEYVASRPSEVQLTFFVRIDEPA